MSSIVGMRRKGRQRGGRHSYGKPEASTVKNHILIDDELRTLIEAERFPEEINNETLWRIIRGRTAKIQELQKKCDALENVILLRNPEQQVSIQQ